MKPLHISLVYLPPAGNVSNAICQLDRVAESLINKNTDWLLAGDFNIDLLAKKNKGNIHKISNFADRNPLIQLIKEPTRSTVSSKSLIDHIYCNVMADVSKSGVTMTLFM